MTLVVVPVQVSIMGFRVSVVRVKDDGGGAVVMMVWVGDVGGGTMVLVVVGKKVKSPPSINMRVASRDKKRSNNQVKNQGRNDKNKRQMTRRNFVVTASDKGQVQHHYAGNIQSVQSATSITLATVLPMVDVTKRNYARLNRATTSEGNHPNPMLAIKGNINQENNKNQARGRAFAIVFQKLRNIRTFISTNFLILIDMEHSVMSLGYEIKIASALKVETNKIVRGCRIKLEGDTFIIDLIPFGHDSFDVIAGMGWLSKLRAKIVCFEKIVKISLSSGEILDVREERLPSPPIGLIDLPIGGRKFTWMNKVVAHD
nr:putative reverse transcriptase domain-containing protein [Tanacetum cinerariifolium]